MVRALSYEVVRTYPRVLRHSAALAIVAVLALFRFLIRTCNKNLFQAQFHKKSRGMQFPTCGC